MFCTHTKELAFFISIYKNTVPWKIGIRKKTNKQYKLSSCQKLDGSSEEGSICKYTLLTLAWKLYHEVCSCATFCYTMCDLQQTDGTWCMSPCVSCSPLLIYSLSLTSMPVQFPPVNVINLCYVWRISFKITGSSALDLYHVPEEQPKKSIASSTECC